MAAAAVVFAGCGGGADEKPAAKTETHERPNFWHARNAGEVGDAYPLWIRALKHQNAGQVCVMLSPRSRQRAIAMQGGSSADEPMAACEAAFRRVIFPRYRKQLAALSSRSEYLKLVSPTIVDVYKRSGAQPTRFIKAGGRWYVEPDRASFPLP